ncbi:TPA: hypothetical protein ACK21Z_003188 [Vibrio harveyi]|uniref:hypothetical protein n=1 Tax=Vibrio harveyi TaxID=669 RepID=UPI0006804E7D|nr:hypothetical protein [Vibrio harveyi]
MQTKLEKQSQYLSAVGRLKLQGCVIVSTFYDLAIPIIEVENPSQSLKKKAIHVTEKLNGVTTKICVARMNGCVVRWLDDGLPSAAQLSKELNQYSPELLNSWPKNF